MEANNQNMLNEMVWTFTKINNPAKTAFKYLDEETKRRRGQKRRTREKMLEKI